MSFVVDDSSLDSSHSASREQRAADVERTGGSGQDFALSATEKQSSDQDFDFALSALPHMAIALYGVNVDIDGVMTSADDALTYTVFTCLRRGLYSHSAANTCIAN